MVASHTGRIRCSRSLSPSLIRRFPPRLRPIPICIYYYIYLLYSPIILHVNSGRVRSVGRQQVPASPQACSRSPSSSWSASGSSRNRTWPAPARRPRPPSASIPCHWRWSWSLRHWRGAARALRGCAVGSVSGRPLRNLAERQRPPLAQSDGMRRTARHHAKSHFSPMVGKLASSRGPSRRPDFFLSSRAGLVETPATHENPVWRWRCRLPAAGSAPRFLLNYNLNQIYSSSILLDSGLRHLYSQPDTCEPSCLPGRICTRTKPVEALA